MGDSMKPQRQAITEEKATKLQIDDIYYLSGRKRVDEKELSRELFKVSFYDLTYSQTEQMLEHLRPLPQLSVGHFHTCIGCEQSFRCTCISNADSDMGECFNCREGISLTAHLYRRY
jgi:hypothetical protein